jgi:hypothetical protein
LHNSDAITHVSSGFTFVGPANTFIGQTLPWQYTR